MAKKNIKTIDRSKVKNTSVLDKKEKAVKKYDNEKLSVDNKNPDNRNLKNTAKNIKNEIQENESPVIPEQKVTDIRTYGSESDYIVVEMVGKYRNIWNYLTKQEQIRRVKENSKDIEIVPIEFKFEESKEIELLLSQTEKIFLDGVLKDVSMENLLIFADRQGEILSNALIELVLENKEQIKKYRAKILTMIMLEHR